MFGGHVFSLPKSFIRQLTLFCLFVSASVLHTMALQHLESVWEGPGEALVLSHPLATLADQFWARLCWEETLKHYPVKCKHIIAMVRARFETHQIQDVS